MDAEMQMIEENQIQTRPEQEESPDFPLDIFFEDDDEALDSSLGKYGRMRKKFLKNYQEEYYTLLRSKHQLREHLLSVQEEAKEQIDYLIQAILEREPAPDKATDQMGWVGHMNMTRMLAEGSVIREFVYAFPEDDEKEENEDKEPGTFGSDFTFEDFPEDEDLQE